MEAWSAGPGLQAESRQPHHLLLLCTRRRGGQGRGASPRRGSPQAPRASDTALRDAQRQIQALEAELEDMKRWNTDLRQRLDEAARKRDASPRGVPAQRLGELEREVDRLLRELGEERSQADGDQQQRMRDETERLRAELDEARGVMAALRGRVDARRLRAEPRDEATMAASSMPNLYVPEATPVTKTTSDSWTTPGHGRSGLGEQLDVSALRERHEEVTRLNQELQCKCWEQLGRSPPRSQPPSRPTSGGMTTLRWQTWLREREEELWGEMRERERGLLEQISETESRLMEREGAWQAKKEAWHAERAALLSQVRWGYVDVFSWTPSSGLVP